MTTGNSHKYLLQPLHFLHPLEPEARRSDYVVPDADREEFLEMRRVLQNNLSSVDVEIRRAQSLLDDLMTQRSKCVLRVQEVDYAIAPHKRLPTEVLIAIFSHYISGAKLPRSTKREDPWHIASVCSKWRQIAFGTQTLWKDLSIGGPRLGSDSDEVAQTRTIVRTLEFAQQITPLGTRNLDIIIPQDIERTSIGVDLLRNVLLPCATQLKSLLLGCSPALLGPLISSSAPPFLALEVLSFHSMGNRVRKSQLYNRSNAIFPFFANAPRLRNCSLHFFDQKILFHKFHIPWGQLTQMSITLDIKTVDIYLFFLQCTRLEVCRLFLQSAHTEHSVTTSQNTVVMPHLRFLYLSMDPIDSFSEVINILVLPSLATLTMEGRIVFSDLASLVERSGCALKALTTLPNSSCSSPESFFRAVSPTLTSLCANFEMDNSIIDRICAGTLLPHLQWISYAVKSPDDLANFSRLVTSRCRGNTNTVSDLRTAYAAVGIGEIDFRNRVRDYCQSLNEHVGGDRTISICNTVEHAPEI